MNSLFSVAGKSALVTGGSRGIGAMIAKALVTAGAHVYLSARHPQQCQNTAKALSQFGSCQAIPADLASEAGIQHLVDTLNHDLTSLDILINNAGATWGSKHFGDYPIEGFDKVMNINLRSPFLLSQKLLPLLSKNASFESPSRIINIGSINGIRTSPNAYAYGASKAALHHLSKTLAQELAHIPITVNAIAPGPFPSKMMAFILNDEAAKQALIDEIPLNRIGNEDDIAGIILYLSSKAGAYVTGQTIAVDGGILTTC